MTHGVSAEAREALHMLATRTLFSVWAELMDAEPSNLTREQSRVVIRAAGFAEVGILSPAERDGWMIRADSCPTEYAAQYPKEAEGWGIADHGARARCAYCGDLDSAEDAAVRDGEALAPEMAAVSHPREVESGTVAEYLRNMALDPDWLIWMSYRGGCSHTLVSREKHGMVTFEHRPAPNAQPDHSIVHDLHGPAARDMNALIFDVTRWLHSLPRHPDHAVLNSVALDLRNNSATDTPGVSAMLVGYVRQATACAHNIRATALRDASLAVAGGRREWRDSAGAWTFSHGADERMYRVMAEWPRQATINRLAAWVRTLHSEARMRKAHARMMDS